MNGSIESDQTARLVLLGDAAEVLKSDVRSGVEGLGLPPLRDLVAKAMERSVSIHVWKGCAVARGATEDDLATLNGVWATPTDVAELIATTDRVVTF